MNTNTNSLSLFSNTHMACCCRCLCASVRVCKCASVQVCLFHGREGSHFLFSPLLHLYEFFKAIKVISNYYHSFMTLNAIIKGKILHLAKQLKLKLNHSPGFRHEERKCLPFSSNFDISPLTCAFKGTFFTLRFLSFLSHSWSTAKIQISQEWPPRLHR